MNRKSNAEIVNLLSTQENTIAALYQAFSAHLPEMKRFWDNLVAQEKAHAEVLEKLAELCVSDKVYLNTGKFNSAAVRTNIDNMNRNIGKVASEGISPIQALALSADIEHSLIESKFFQIIESKLPSVKKEIDEIEKHTRQHATMVDKLLQELRDDPMKRDSATPDIKAKIIAAQRGIIDQLAKCEETISKLYSLYSRNIPDLSDFWADLSQKEQTHAKLLKTMHKQLDQGHIFQNIGRFSSESIIAFQRKLNDAINEAEQGSISAKDAIENALSTESSIIDAHFYDIVKSDSEEFRIIADRLSSDTHSHVKAVQDQLIKLRNKTVA